MLRGQFNDTRSYPHRSIVSQRPGRTGEEYGGVQSFAGIDGVYGACKIKVNGVEVGTNRMGIGRRKRHGSEIPAEHLHVPVVAHGARIQHDGGTLGIEYHVSVEPCSIVEQQVEHANLSGRGHGE